MNFPEDQTVIGLMADIVSAYVSHNAIRQDELAGLIGDVHAALKKAPNGAART